MELLQKQIQQLSQQQIQRLEVLQMSALELHDYLQELFQDNPVVDLNTVEPVEPEGESQRLQQLRWLADSDRQNRYYQIIGEYENDPFARIEADGGLEETLPQFIDRQLDQTRIDTKTAQAVHMLASCLDWDGYLRIPLDELASDAGLPLVQLKDGLKVLHTLEPAGVGAENLSQCLELQLEHAGVDGPVLTIVRDHLEALARCHYRRIADQLGITTDDVLSAQRIIRELDPRPGAIFQ